MSADWNTWLLTFVAITSGISAFAQSFNAIHQLWINLHNIRQFWSKKLGRGWAAVERRSTMTDPSRIGTVHHVTLTVENKKQYE